MRLVLELLVALPRFCRQRTALGTCRPVVTWKLPHHTWGEWGGSDRSHSTQRKAHPLPVRPPLLTPPPSASPYPLQQAHREGWKQGLRELGLEGVQELFGAGIVERQEAWDGGSRGTGVRTGVRTGGGGGGRASRLRREREGTLVEVAVYAQAVGHRAVQHFDLVGVLGGEAGLQPVVGMQTPGCCCLAQLLEAAQAAVGHTQAEGLAVRFKAHLPIVLPSVNQRVP